MPAKRGVATDDCNQVAAHLVGLAFGRTTAHLSLIIPPFRAFWQLNGLPNGKTCKTRNLRKQWDKDKLISVVSLVCRAARLFRVLNGRREGVLPANREDRQSECHWVVPGALRKADRESDYTALISEASYGSLMAVGRKPV